MSNYREITIKPNKNNAGNKARQTQIYRGISTVDPNRTTFNKYDTELIKQDLINHFNIRKGEKIYNADFGTVIWDVLYDPLTDDSKDAVLQDVQAIMDNDPRINVDRIQLVQKDYGIQIYCEITYLKQSIVEELVFNFDRDAGLSLL